MNKKPKNIILDRDDTLLYFDQDKIKVIYQQIVEIAPEIDIQKLYDYWENGREAKFPSSIDQENTFWLKFWHEEVPALFPISGYQSEKLMQIGNFIYDVFSPFQDTQMFLDGLRERNLNVGVLTNFEMPNVRKTFAMAGVNIDFIPDKYLVNSSMVGYEKPHRKSFEFMLDRMNATPESTAFVDDDINNVIAAEEIGLTAFLIDRDDKHNGIRKKIVVRGLMEIFAVI